MIQTTAIIETLKRELRARRITYAHVADTLSLSEASVKRLFAEKSFTLQRLEQVCNLIDLEFDNLVSITRKRQNQLEQLTQAQETEIASDITLLMIALSVINGFTFNDLVDYYKLSEHKCIQKLAILDRIKFLDLLPNNRIKLRISPNFHWRARGPIQAFFRQKVEKDFFNSHFDQDGEKLLVLNGLFASASNRQLQEKMEKLAAEFNQQMQEDAHIPMNEKFGTTMVIALRQWQYSLFKEKMR